MHIIEWGHYSLILALCLSVVQASTIFFERFVPPISHRIFSTSVFLLLFASLCSLTYGYIISDFSLINVMDNSHTAKPLIYKIAGVWGNHEGSSLLWVLSMSIFATLFSCNWQKAPEKLYKKTLAVQAALIAKFCVFLLLTSNPFQRAFPFPMEGLDLNPLLQDPGLTYHPPTLYIGYVGFSLVFSLACGALLSKEISWARYVRPWALLSWGILTLGITAGSWWAYYVLGWGGWWFWDPVETVSLFPWIVGLMLIHSLWATRTSTALTLWSLSLCLLAFTCSLFGVFLVRSGLLTSVHMFAVDTSRGYFLLLLISLLAIPAYTLLAARGKYLQGDRPISFLTQGFSILLNNALFLFALFTVFIGTIYPLILERFWGENLNVGGGYYNSLFWPLIPLLAIGVAWGPLLPNNQHKKKEGLKSLQKLIYAFGISAGIAMLAASFPLLEWVKSAPFTKQLFLYVGWFSGLLIVVSSYYQGRRSFKNRRFWKSFGMLLSHFGCGLFLLSVSYQETFEEELLRKVTLGVPTEVHGYDITLDKVEVVPGANYISNRGMLTISQGGNVLQNSYPSRRFFYVRNQVLAKSVIYTNGMLNLYITLGERHEDGTWTLRVHYNPLVPWIWGSGILVALGALWGFCVAISRKGMKK